MYNDGQVHITPPRHKLLTYNSTVWSDNNFLFSNEQLMNIANNKVFFFFFFFCYGISMRQSYLVLLIFLL